MQDSLLPVNFVPLASLCAKFSVFLWVCLGRLGLFSEAAGYFLYSSNRADHNLFVLYRHIVEYAVWYATFWEQIEKRKEIIKSSEEDIDQERKSRSLNSRKRKFVEICQCLFHTKKWNKTSNKSERIWYISTASSWSLKK